MDLNYVDSFDLFGVKARQKACKPGTGAPTTTTEGAVGDLYMDTTTGDIYKCTAVTDGVYTWDTCAVMGVFYVDMEYAAGTDALHDLVTPWDDVVEAYNNGKTLILRQRSNVSGVGYYSSFNLVDVSTDGIVYFEFSRINNFGSLYTYRVQKNGYVSVTKHEHGNVHTVNGVSPDENCNLEIEVGGVNDAVLYTEQTLTPEQQAQARKNIGAASTTDVEVTLKALLSNNNVPIIELGYVNANTGEISPNTGSATYNLRARTTTKTVVSGSFLIVVPEGYCTRVMRYGVSYQGYDDWQTGIIHLNPEEEITIHLTLAHIDTTQTITEEDIAFIQDHLLMGSCDIASGASSGPDYPLYEDCAPNLVFEFGTILSSDGSNSNATTRIRTRDFLPAKNFTCSIDTGYKFVLYAYDANQALIQKTGWLNAPTYVDIATISDCAYVRIILAKSDDTTITNEEFDAVKDAFHLVYGITDSTLTQKGMPADAYTVGEKLNNFGELAKKSIRVLGIGNSYTRDSFRWLWKILKECGYGDVVVAHGYWGGSTLAQQYASLNETDENHAIYTYWKYTSQNAVQTASSNLPAIIADEPWDIVLFQQQSDLAGQYDSFVSADFDINDFISYVKTAIGNDKLKIGIAQTWSHAAGYSSEKFQTMYGSDPDTQLQAINTTIPQVANHMSQCDFIINTGKAVELGRANQFLGALGDEMLRPDKNHLAFGIPSFMAGMVYAITLCGVKPCDVSWYPTTADDAEIVTDTSAYLAYLAKQCAVLAAQSI